MHTTLYTQRILRKMWEEKGGANHSLQALMKDTLPQLHLNSVMMQAAAR